jgi:hypothetical protein
MSGDFASLSQSPQVREVIQADINRLNARLNRWETIKKFTDARNFAAGLVSLDPEALPKFATERGVDNEVGGQPGQGLGRGLDRAGGDALAT